MKRIPHSPSFQPEENTEKAPKIENNEMFRSALVRTNVIIDLRYICVLRSWCDWLPSELTEP